VSGFALGGAIGVILEDIGIIVEGRIGLSFTISELSSCEHKS